METIPAHARKFIGKRLSAAHPVNGGKQTPMKGHPVFVAQHVTAARGICGSERHAPNRASSWVFPIRGTGNLHRSVFDGGIAPHPAVSEKHASLRPSTDRVLSVQAVPDQFRNGEYWPAYARFPLQVVVLDFNAYSHHGPCLPERRPIILSEEGTRITTPPPLPGASLGHNMLCDKGLACYWHLGLSSGP